MPPHPYRERGKHDMAERVGARLEWGAPVAKPLLLHRIK